MHLPTVKVAFRLHERKNETRFYTMVLDSKRYNYTLKGIIILILLSKIP